MLKSLAAMTGSLPAWILVFAGLLLTTPATSQTVAVNVCALEVGVISPLIGATVSAEGVVGTTGPDGCAVLAVTVDAEDPETPNTGEVLALSAPYPNPTAGKAIIPIQSTLAQPITLRVYDLLGRQVIPSRIVHTVAGHSQLDLDLSSLTSGIYFYQVTTPSGHRVGKIIKQETRRSISPSTTPSLRHPDANSPSNSTLRSAKNVEFTVAKTGYKTTMFTRDVKADNELTILMERAPTNETITTDTVGVALSDILAGTYKGFEGGLYDGGINEMAGDHFAAGIQFANAVEPLDLNGNPSENGVYILMSFGMSNTTQEFCSQNSDLPCDNWTFMGQAANDPLVNKTHLRIVNGAKGGEAAEFWENANQDNYNRIRDEKLIPQGFSENQVQIAWVKIANRQPVSPLPNNDADAFRLKTQMGSMVRALKIRYPNLKQVFFTSRIYAGYGRRPLNPEPYAFESALAIKWAVQAQIEQMRGQNVDDHTGDVDYNGPGAWMAWGAYPWAFGLDARLDGLSWAESDFETDRTHPAQPGEEKIGTLLLAFFKASPHTACWFLEDGICQ